MLERLTRWWNAREKAANADGYIRASLSALERTHDGKAPPFSPRSAVSHYASWVYAACTINGNAVASNPLRLYVRGARGRKALWTTRAPGLRQRAYMLGDGRQRPSPTVMRKAAELGSDFEEVTGAHPVLRLLAVSNPFINGYDATVLRVVWQELTGNAFLHVVTDPFAGVPSELWPMMPQWTTVIPDQRDFVRGYLYGRDSTQQIQLEPDEVIHFKRPNPSDLFYGMGKLQAAWGAANANAALHEMDLAMFRNHARPDWAMVIKGAASPDSIKALEAQLKAKFQGPRQAGHFLITTADIDLKPLQFPTKDITGRDDIVEEIAAVFGVPVSLLKANDPNLASATAGYQSWREMTVLPMCRMDEEVLNQRLLPMFGLGDDAVLAYDNPVPLDRSMDLQERTAAVGGGWMTPNEARQQQGLEPLEDPHANMLHVGGQPLGGSPAGGPLGPLGLALAPGAAGGPAGLPGGPAAPQGTPAATAAMPQQAAAQPGPAQPLEARAVAAASDLLGQVRKGELAAGAATELLTALGFGRDSAGQMVAAQAPQPQQAAADPACVADKISKLVAEGYPQEQAVAIAYSMCEGKAAPGAIGKALEDIDTVPPQAVADNARRALEVRESKPPSQRGMTAVGIARARDLMNRVALSEQTIRRMLAYFERHEVDKRGETWDEQGKGWQAWQGWGGDEGWAWARRKVEEFDRARGEKSACGCGCGTVSQKAMWTDAVTVKSTGEQVDDKLLKGWLRGVEKVLRDQVRDVVKAINAEQSPTADTVARVLRVLRSSGYDGQLMEAMQPYLERALRHGAAEGIKGLTRIARTPAIAQFGWSSKELDEYVRRASVTLATTAADGMQATTEVALSDLIGRGLQEGKTVAQLATSVQDWAGEEDDPERATRKRALMVARTEASRASGQASQDAWEATGLVEGKRWLLAPDPCEFCEAAAEMFGSDGIGLRDAFFEQGSTLKGADGNEMTLDYGAVTAPPLHPHCRCSMVPVLSGRYEELAQELERRIAGDGK